MQPAEDIETGPAGQQGSACWCSSHVAYSDLWPVVQNDLWHAHPVVCVLDSNQNLNQLCAATC